MTTGKSKKMGRPKLPKEQVRGKIVPVRLGEVELLAETSGAKAYKQTLSDFIRDDLKAWDYRLDLQGVDALIWDGAGNGSRKILGVIFKERQDDGNRFEVNQELIADEKGDEYRTLEMDSELRKRGIEEVWVITTKSPFWRSTIYVKLSKSTKPITIIKRY